LKQNISVQQKIESMDSCSTEDFESNLSYSEEGFASIDHVQQKVCITRSFSAE
jgi:hypothetical protein